MRDGSCLPRGFPNSTLFFVVLFIAGTSGSLYARQPLAHFDQILIVRELAHEIAVAKIPLPWGKHGVHVNAQGEIDQAQAAKELREKGMSSNLGGRWRSQESSSDRVGLSLQLMEVEKAASTGISILRLAWAPCLSRLRRARTRPLPPTVPTSRSSFPGTILIPPRNR